MRDNEADPGILANSKGQSQVHVDEGRVTWMHPLLLVTGRSALILLAQALVALIFFLRGTSNPWLAAAPWWTVYGTFVDLGCLVMLWKFTRAEGITIRDLIGPLRLRYGRDFFLGVAILLVVFPLFVGGGLLTCRWLYGGYQVNLYPGILSGRVLPVWAAIYSRSIWWLIWSPAEQITYAGYVLPRLQALSSRTSVAVAVVGFWWTIQHPFLPFIPDWRCFLWRFLAFAPGVVAITLIYLRMRRLAPLIVAHWAMDLVATFMTMGE
jgi:hypothetical protein